MNNTPSYFDSGLRGLWSSLLGCFCLAMAAGFWAAPASANSGDTLSDIQNRGTLRCGVSEGITGFSIRDAAGHWSGIDVDFCRAVAAATLGDASRVTFIPLNAHARFQALGSQDIDILARNTTWSVFREATFSAQFIGVLYYDSEGFVVRSDSKYAHGEALNGARICVEDASNQLVNVTEYAQALHWQVVTVLAVDFKAARRDFYAGTCDVLTDDRSALAEMLLQAPHPADYVIRADQFAKEPFSPAVRWDDGAWVALVRAVYAALLNADETGLTQAQASMISPDSATKNPAFAAYLNETAPVGSALGLAPDWAAKAVAAAGNYGQMFDRDLGAGSALKLDRGPNKPWTEGGLLYAPPFQ